MIVIVNTDTSKLLGYVSFGGVVDTENSETYSFEWDGVIPEPLHHYEAYDSDGWKVRKKTTDTINTEAAQLKWKQVRAERDRLLKKSDGMYLRQLGENTLDDYHSNLLNQYRQDLRDVPDQSNPFAITWPTWPL